MNWVFYGYMVLALIVLGIIWEQFGKKVKGKTIGWGDVLVWVLNILLCFFIAQGGPII